MKPVEFKLIMNTSRSAEACSAEIKGGNRQVSLCHFKREVSCEIVKKKKRKKEKKWQEAPSDNLPLSGLALPSVASNGSGYHVCI